MMTASSQEQKPIRQKMTTVAAASFSGALIEWYDFSLYAIAAALVFDKLFFPQFDANVGTIASFATFAVGYLARPIGGLICGHFGDRIGRRKLLLFTVLVMGGSTVLVGLLPTYASIGIWAPILLVILRVLQGIALGGEYAGAALITIEHAPRNRRALWASVPQMASPSGVLVGTGIFTLASTLPEPHFLSWGWRVPFLLSILMLAVGLYIRLRIAETPDFVAAKTGGQVTRMPLVELLRTYPANITLAFGAALAQTVSYQVFNVFAIAYLTGTVNMPPNVVLTGTMLASGFGVVMTPIAGWFGDRIGTARTYLIGAGFTVMFAFPFFMLLNQQVTALVWAALIAGYIFGSVIMFAVQATFFSDLFGTHVRYTGLSLAFQGSGVVGGLTPLVAAALFVGASGTPWAVAGFVAMIGLISFGSTCLAGRSSAVRRVASAVPHEPVGDVEEGNGVR